MATIDEEKRDAVLLVNPNRGAIEWVQRYHRSLWHIILPTDFARTLCGRDPDFWDYPRIFTRETFDIEGERSGLCKICLKRYEAALVATPPAQEEGER